MIWLEGMYEKVFFIELPKVQIGAQMFLTDFVDADGHSWLLQLDANIYSEVEKYQDLSGHQLVITGEYSGYTNVYQKPTLLLEKIFDKTTNNIICSVLFSVTHE